MEFLHEPKVWVAVAFLGFVGMFGRMIYRALTKGLDGRATRIRDELEEAAKLRMEAELLLANYKRKYQESVREAEGILAKAREDAALLAANAQEELKRMLQARTKLAEQRIAQAEQAAIRDVQNHVVDITISAAKAIVVEQLSDMPQDEMIERAIAQIERKVH